MKVKKYKTVGKVVNALEQANKIVCEKYFPSAPPLNNKNEKI